jgi:hypothetical protein
VGDFVSLLHDLNLSPLNTILLVIIAFFLWLAAKHILKRFTCLETRTERVERRNRKEDHAIWRLENELGLEPIPDDDEG